MVEELTLGIDVGTGSAKGVLADVTGEFFASATHAYRYTSPSPGAAEQDPQIWWDAVCAVSKALLQQCPDAAQRLRGIAISGQGVATVLLDEHGCSIHDAMLWMDTRCASEAERLAELHGAAIAEISGKQPAAYNVEPKLLWLRTHKPEIWKRLHQVTTTTGYITRRLTGRAVMNHSDAGLMLGYDLKQRMWSNTSLALMDLPHAIYCDLAEADEVVGHITQESAQETGLPVGLLVVAGGEDTACAGLAMGVTSESDVQLSMGTACTVYIPFVKPATDSRLIAFPHVIRGLTLMGGSMVAGGISIEWLMRLLGHKAVATDARSEQLLSLTEDAMQGTVGSGGLIFLPYLAGELQPINDGFARGVFFGLHLQTEPVHMLRAIMEGTAFAIRHNLDVACECGALPARIIATGGPSKNDLWCQIIADVTGLPLSAMGEQVGSALGDAILAALGAGLIRDPLRMQRAHARSRREFYPRSDAIQIYSQIYAIYRRLYPQLKDLFQQAAEIQTSSNPRLRG